MEECKNCKGDIVVFEGKWWHLDKLGENLRILQKERTYSTKIITCKYCDNSKTERKICNNPEPARFGGFIKNQ